jgi:hypothetical protein
MERYGRAALLRRVGLPRRSFSEDGWGERTREPSFSPRELAGREPKRGVLIKTIEPFTAKSIRL